MPRAHGPAQRHPGRCKATGQSQYAVNGTPTFIIGGQTLVGAWPFAKFDSLLKSLLLVATRGYCPFCSPAAAFSTSRHTRSRFSPQIFLICASV